MSCCVECKIVSMWHEARRQERKIRVMMVDYVKRADRRRQYYEQIVSLVNYGIDANTVTSRL